MVPSLKTHILFIVISLFSQHGNSLSFPGKGWNFVVSPFRSVKCYFFECCDDIDNNVEGLSLYLSRHLHGQHLVTELVPRYIQAHISDNNPSKALVLSFHGSTGTGKTFASHIVAEHLYKEGINSRYVHVISELKDFPSKSRIDKYKLQKRIESAAKSCHQNLFIFEHMDRMSSEMIEVITPYLDNYPSIDGIDYRKNIFIFLCNMGAKQINDYALSHWKMGRLREYIKLSDFRRTVTTAAYNEQGGLWHYPLVDHGLVSAFIPLLPLERQHIIECIKDELQKRKKLHELSGGFINQVAAEFLYFPKRLELFSIFGCWKVSMKVSEMLINKEEL